MSEHHFSVEEWEPGDPIDEAHLAECEDCRSQWELMRFLRFQIESLPQVTPSPFFASRTARRIEGSTADLWHLVDRLAKLLVPAFATAAFATAFLLFSLDSGSAVPDDYTQVLLEPSASEEITLDDVVFQLLEENGN
jgi:hypothetical protein